MWFLVLGFASFIYFGNNIRCNFRDKWILEAHQQNLIELRTEFGNLKFAMSDLKNELNVHKKITMETNEKFMKQSSVTMTKIDNIMKTLFNDPNAIKYIKKDYANIYNQFDNLKIELGAGELLKTLQREDIKELMKKSNTFPVLEREKLLNLTEDLIGKLTNCSTLISEQLINGLSAGIIELELEINWNSVKLAATIATFTLTSIYGDQLKNYAETIITKLSNLETKRTMIEKLNEAYKYLEELKKLKPLLETGKSLVNFFSSV